MNNLKISTKDESVRMFDNPILDYFSRVHWSTPLILFIPIIFYMLYLAYQTHHWSVTQIVGLFILGLAIWTFAEYVMHRFVFHYQPPGKWGAKIHYLTHGVHHAYPNDSKRLVLPPVLSIPLASGFYFLFYYVLGTVITPPFFAGFLLGYLIYDMLHYALHHAHIKSEWFKKLKEHHMWHHFKDQHKGYGVSSKFWDIVFRTTFKF